MLAWLRDLALRVLSTLGLYSKNATVVLLGTGAEFVLDSEMFESG